MAGELVHLVVSGGVGTITLDSPDNRNALSTQLVAHLGRQFAAAQADERVRVIVLTGAGPVFCSGADLKEQRVANEAGQRTGAHAGAGIGGVAAILLAMVESPKPVVGRIHGAARAGGMGLVAACDIAVGVEGATFGLSEVRIGVAPAIISVVLIPRLGAAKARELFLTGATFGASEAVRVGLLNASAEREQLDAKVAEYVDALLLGSPKALAASKELVRRVPAMPMAEAFPWASALSAELFAGEDALEGMSAFAERRLPRWAART